MRICLIEPFFTGSHAAWAKGYQAHSGHDVEILSLSGRFWKWRMHGGAATLARQFRDLGQRPDLIIASDMLDLSTFLGLCRKEVEGIPVAVYFHENQLTYPWSPDDQDVKLKRDNHYGWLNFTTALAADRLFFNSDFHRRSFLGALPDFLVQFPDHRELDTVAEIAAKSETLWLGMDLARLDGFQTNKTNGPPVILWNHRWEYDKAPDDFFRLLFELAEEGEAFRLIVLGESYRKSPPIFEEARTRLSDRIIHFGYAEDFSQYARLLWQADLLPVTSRQDFFGGSIVEAIYCGVCPLLPDRLSYPGHLPETNQEAWLYGSEAELKEKLRGMLRKKPEEAGLAARMARYDLSRMAGEYDRRFEQFSLE